VTIGVGATYAVNAAGTPTSAMIFPHPIVVTGTNMAITGRFTDPTGWGMDYNPDHVELNRL
jgi:hypothetical protein